jgi:hypothetical protein
MKKTMKPKRFQKIVDHMSKRGMPTGVQPKDVGDSMSVEQEAMEVAPDAVAREDEDKKKKK